MKRSWLLWALVLLLPLPGLAQQVSSQVSGLSLPATPNRQIVLDVAVTDESGKPVNGLRQEDFHLLDDKQPQKILSFREAKGGSTSDPILVILLIDTVNASFQSVGYERQEIQKYLEQSGGQLAYPVWAVVLFDTEIKPLGLPSRDGRALSALLNQHATALRSSTRAAGVMGGMERLRISLRALDAIAAHESGRPGKKIFIWVSPGWPVPEGPRVEMGPKDGQSLFDNIVDLSARLRQARITLYSIDPLGTSDAGPRTRYYLQYLNGVKAPYQALPGNLALQVLAVQTGGLVLNTTNDLTGEIATCVADANAFYVLSFNSPPADHPNEYHRLEVKVDRPGMTVRTRSEYYAQP